MAYYQITMGKLKETGEAVALVQIKYDAQAVAAIKAIAGSRWHPAVKAWTVPAAAKADLETVVAAAASRQPVRKGGSKIFPGVRGYEEGEEVHPEERPGYSRTFR